MKNSKALVAMVAIAFVIAIDATAGGTASAATAMVGPGTASGLSTLAAKPPIPTKGDKGDKDDDEGDKDDDEGAATLTSISPISGPTTGGTSVHLSGEGIVCAPTFPAVAFGNAAAVVVSCGSTAVTAAAPAHAAGVVQVTLTNAGSPASNGLAYAYLAPDPPRFIGQATAYNVVTVSFSKPVCRSAPFDYADWTVKFLGFPITAPVVGASIPVCDVSFGNAVTSARLFLSSYGAMARLPERWLRSL
jgi:hypothetical protein